MKTWYKAVCDRCGEAIDLFVNNPTCTKHYLSDNDAKIQAWLTRHYGCELRMVWRDGQMDKLWEDGYERDESQCKDGFTVIARKDAGAELLRDGPCRCMIVDPNGMALGRKFVATCSMESKPHVGKKGFAERIRPGKVHITLDDGTSLWGHECWWVKLEKGE